MTPHELRQIAELAKEVRGKRYATMRRMRFEDGKTLQEIADTFGISRQAVHSLFQRKQWTTAQ